MLNNRFLIGSFLFSIYAIGNIYSDAANPPPSSSSTVRGSGREEIAFNDDTRHDLYRRYENRNNWDYRQNWRQDTNAYLQGDMSLQEGPPGQYHYPSSSYQQYQNYPGNASYNQNYPGVAPSYYQQSYHNYSGTSYPNDPTNSDPGRQNRPQKSWYYRQNWRKNSDAYLRGANPMSYRNKQRESYRQKLDQEQRQKEIAMEVSKRLQQLSLTQSNSNSYMSQNQNTNRNPQATNSKSNSNPSYTTQNTNRSPTSTHAEPGNYSHSYYL